MLRSKSRSGYLDFGQKKHSSVLIRTISGSKICRGDALASQVDKHALVSVERNARHSISLSENRIVKAAMMQKQVSNLEEELTNTKERLDATEGERNQALIDLKSLKDSLSNSRKEIESKDNEMNFLSTQLQSTKALEVKLAEREASLDEMKKRVRELEEEVEKAKQSESNMLESLMLQTKQIEQTKMDLEESKLEIVTLHEKLAKLQKGGKNEHDNYSLTKESMADRTANQDRVQDGEKIASSQTKALMDEIRMLKNELKLATEAEEKSKKAMDDLASALREVATESSMAKEKLKSTEDEVTHLKEMLRTTEDKYIKQIDELKKEIEYQTNTAERLRVEAEESLLAWNGKEMGFVSCIRRADEESALAKHENNRLKEALVAAENSTRIAREETYKLRDILKQAINESNVAKEASNIARAENSELKDLLAEKEEALHFLTKENERLRINEVAARENVKEFKRLLAAKSEVKPLAISEVKPCDDKEQGDVFNSPLSSLYEEHLDGRMTPQHTFSFDLDDLKVFNKEEDDNATNIVVHDDPEKAEALKGSIFDTSSSPRSEPQTPKPKVHQRRASLVYTDEAGTVQPEDVENVHSSSSGHAEDAEDKSYYSKKRLFRKIGELIIGKSYSKKEVPTEQPKEQAKEQPKEQAN